MQPLFRSSGFTLIELCLLLVLFGVLSSLAVPSLSESLARARTGAVLNRLSGDLFLARSLAAREGRPVRVRFEPASGCADLYELVTEEGRVLRRVTANPARTGVCLRGNVPGAMRVNSRGMLIGSPRRVVARSGRAADSVTISLVGRVYRWR